MQVAGRRRSLKHALPTHGRGAEIPLLENIPGLQFCRTAVKGTPQVIFSSFPEDRITKLTMTIIRKL